MTAVNAVLQQLHNDKTALELTLQDQINLNLQMRSNLIGSQNMIKQLNDQLEELKAKLSKLENVPSSNETDSEKKDN